MLKEFKEFIMEGDLVTIAVGLILALKFKDVVDSLTEHIINPIIGAIFGKPNFNSLTLGIGDAEIMYGSFITVLISFIIVGFVLFMIVKAYNAAKARFEKPAVESDETSEEVVLLREIRDSLRNRA